MLNDNGVWHEDCKIESTNTKGRYTMEKTRALNREMNLIIMLMTAILMIFMTQDLLAANNDDSASFIQQIENELTLLDEIESDYRSVNPEHACQYYMWRVNMNAFVQTIEKELTAIDYRESSEESILSEKLSEVAEYYARHGVNGEHYSHLN